MNLIRLAINTQRWDLAAHTLVYTAAKVCIEGGKKGGGKKEPKTEKQN